MRRLAAMLATVAVLATMSVPTPVSALSSRKVVIVVGPVGTVTDHYRSDANTAAAAARAYSSNVVTVYSPNATWAAVSQALQGASIVVYMGHGNGFPSPYSSTLMPDRQDGMGLNPVAGVDDTAHTYWGESWIASTVRLAPGALVVLGHLCYSAGAGEPGQATPTLDVARQRVDNYAAGWVKAGARAVVSDATYGQAAYYIRAAFSTAQPIDTVFRTAATYHGNVKTFASVRQPGFVDELDPDTPTGNYHRSIVLAPGLRTTDVIGGGATLPPPQPAGFIVPPAPGTVTTARSNTISWTSATPGAVATITEEVVPAVNNACPALGWKKAWTLSHASPFTIVGFTVGDCYRYNITDSKGTTVPLASGTLRIVPKAVVRFTFPVAGKTTAGLTSNTVKWTATPAPGGPAIVATTVLEQYAKPVVAGSCVGVTWRNAWSRVTVSPFAIVGFSHRTCYRYRATTRDAAGTYSSAWSGALYVR